MKKLFLIIMASVLFAALSVPSSLAAEKPITFKLSVETTENMHQNKALKIFRCLLEKNSKGRLKVDYYHSAQLYKGRDVPKALRMGTLQMGVVGTWLLGGIDSNANISALPMFFGLPEGVTKKVIDDGVDKFVNERLEKKLATKVLGRWYYHTDSNVNMKDKPIKSLADYKGKKIRYPGSAAVSLRLQALGANPIRIPWPDVHMALMQGTVDGLIVGYKPFARTKLWETGVNYVTEERSWYVHFIPMMNGKFWRSLPQDLQKVILDTWEEHVDMERAISEYDERQAIKIMRDNGVQIYKPSAEQLAEWRDVAMTKQDEIVAELGMDKALVEKVKKDYVEKYLSK